MFHRWTPPAYHLPVGIGRPSLRFPRSKFEREEPERGLPGDSTGNGPLLPAIRGLVIPTLRIYIYIYINRNFEGGGGDSPNLP